MQKAQAKQTAIPKRPLWEFVEHPLTLTVCAIAAGVIGVVYFTPVLVLCGFLLFIAVVRTKVVTATGIKRGLAYVGISLAISILVYEANRIIKSKLEPAPTRPMPEITILGYEVALFNQNYNPFANVFFQNIGGRGKITVYSSAGVALAAADEPAIIKELESSTKKLVAEGGGLVFSVKPQEKKWFTVKGPPLSTNKAESLKQGKSKFFFSGIIVVNGGGSQDYKFCSFVVGNKPSVVLQCPEN